MDPGPIDGVMGARTQAALRAYQKDQNLPQTGVGPTLKPSRGLGSHAEFVKDGLPTFKRGPGTVTPGPRRVRHLAPSVLLGTWTKGPSEALRGVRWPTRPTLRPTQKEE